MVERVAAVKGSLDERIGEITLLLHRWSGGDSNAADELVRLLYPELKRIAVSRMRFERQDHTLQPTALVSEFFLHLARSRGLGWNNRAHFLAVASRVIRQVLIDYARGRNANKRGGKTINIQLDDLQLPADLGPADVIKIDDLLEQLAKEDQRMAQVVEMRCFGGLTHEEIGDALGVTERTVKRDWQVARAWLIGQLRKG
jgi:RNA polymerase sigma-70 factor (ECF subfamily)